MSTIAAFRLGPHGPAYEPYGVLSYSPEQHRHVLAEFGDRATAEAVRARLAHDVDLSALLMRQDAGEWTLDTPGGTR